MHATGHYHELRDLFRGSNPMTRATSARDIIVIGASAGGVEALRRLASLLPADLPAAIFVVLHAWAESRSYLPEILSRAGPLPAQHPTNGDTIVPGRIYIAPPDLHMILEHDRILTIRGPRENASRPAINPLFRSAAAEFGPRVVGVILSGTLEDGIAGLWAVKRCGGIAVVQEPAEAAYAEMPQAALREVSIDHTLPLAEMAQLLFRLARELLPAAPRPAVPAEVELNNAAVKMEANGLMVDQLGQRTLFTCPECNGALWEIAEGAQPQFRCHVGHAYSPAALELGQNLTIEQALWSALRALKESAALDDRLAQRSDAHQLEKAAASHRHHAAEKLAQAETLLRFLHALPGATPMP
jgi:two-component system chemotaxis response regulator CheB